MLYSIMDINHVFNTPIKVLKEKVKNNKQITLLEIDNLRLDEEAMIHSNQAETAYGVAEIIDKKIINQMVLSNTLVKQGMLAIIQAYLRR